MRGRYPKLSYPDLRRIDAWAVKRKISARAMARVLGVALNTFYDAWKRRNAYRECA
jgi:hypothetical protein